MQNIKILIAIMLLYPVNAMSSQAYEVREFAILCQEIKDAQLIHHAMLALPESRREKIIADRIKDSRCFYGHNFKTLEVIKKSSDFWEVKPQGLQNRSFWVHSLFLTKKR